MNDRYDWQAVYPPGLERGYSPPARQLWRALEAHALRTPQKPAIHFENMTVSYGALWACVERNAAALRSRGYGKGKRGDRVIIVMPNSPEFVAFYYAALRADMVVVAANPKLTRDELAEILVQTEPRVAFVCNDAAGEFEAGRVKARIREPRTFFVKPGREFSAAAPMLDIVQDVLGEPGDCLARTDLDVAMLQFTSGTTGGLKAAMMSHRNLWANAEQNNRWFGWTENDVILGALPLYHTWGMCCVMNATILAGASMALIPEFRPDAVLETLQRHKVTVAYGSGTMFHRMLDAAGDFTERFFGGLRYVKAGAMLIDGSLNKRWQAAVPGVPMVNGYGLTEAGPEVCNNPPGKVQVGTVGVPLPGTEIRLGRLDQPEVEAELGTEGEIQVRGPQVMLGYWSEPEATRATILPGGWLRTGDIGRFEPDGYLRIVDRLKDLIKFRGFSVAPSEIEKVLLTHPLVKEVSVVGKPDAVDGEVPVAYIVMREGASPDTSDMPAFLEPHLTSYKLPRRYHVVHEIPKNHVGKPLKRVLRELPE